MKGSTHRMFAPIFATGIAYPYLIQQNKLNLPIYLSVPIFAGVIGASYLSANWADADCHAYKPKSVIMGTAKRNKDGYYYVRNKKTKELEKKVADFLKGKTGIYVIVNNDPRPRDQGGAGYTGHIDLIQNGHIPWGSNHLNVPGGIKYIRIWQFIDIILKEHNDIYKLEIKNEGIQIVDTTSIFSAYYQQKDKNIGFGLGLSIVKEICDKYEIKIEVNSLNNQTTFSYIFPKNLISKGEILWKYFY